MKLRAERDQVGHVASNGAGGRKGSSPASCTLPEEFPYADIWGLLKRSRYKC